MWTRSALVICTFFMAKTYVCQNISGSCIVVLIGIALDRPLPTFPSWTTCKIRHHVFTTFDARIIRNVKCIKNVLEVLKSSKYISLFEPRQSEKELVTLVLHFRQHFLIVLCGQPSRSYSHLRLANFSDRVLTVSLKQDKRCSARQSIHLISALLWGRVSWEFLCS